MRTIDYESILCDVFNCSKPDLQLCIALNPSEAMQMAVRQAVENYQDEE